MINIIQHGRKYIAPTPPTYYSCTCPNCECKFEFSNRDCDYTYDMVSTTVSATGRPASFINCPECKKRTYEWYWKSKTEG